MITKGTSEPMDYPKTGHDRQERRGEERSHLRDRRYMPQTNSGSFVIPNSCTCGRAGRQRLWWPRIMLLISDNGPVLCQCRLTIRVANQAEPA